MLTWRRTPIPAKITFEGGNTYSHTHQGIDIERVDLSQFTRPTVLLRVAENAYKTFTVESNHAVNFSFVV